MRYLTRSEHLLLILAINGIIFQSQGFSTNITNNSQPSAFEYQCVHKKNETFTSVINLQQPAIGLVVSDRIVDQLITRIFAIFLREQLNYKNVTLIAHKYVKPNGTIIDDDFEGNKLLDLLKLIRHHQPYSDLLMISLAVWMPPVAHGLLPETISEMGPSITPGRFGWFVPKFYANNSIDSELSHEIFLDPSHVKYKDFIIPDNLWQDLHKNGEIEREFISPSCMQKPVECATMLAEYPYDSEFVEREIVEMGSYLKILWLGAQFRKKVKWLQERYESDGRYANKPFMILHWTPSDVIDTNLNFVQIDQPKCETSNAMLLAYCKYEMTPILKYVSNNVAKKENTQLVRFLRKFYIQDAALQTILQAYDKMDHDITLDARYNAIACSWYRTNSAIFNVWSNLPPKITLAIGGIFPITTDIRRGHKNLVKAVHHAVRAINRNSSILANHDLTVLENDDQCKADVVMRSFLHYFSQPNLLGVIGPACSETVEPIAGIAKHTKMAVISYSAEGATFVDRETYPYFFRTIGSNRQYEDAYIRLMQEMKWRRIAALTEDGQRYTEYISHMETSMKKFNLELIVNKKFSADVTADEMRKHLSDLKSRRAKIIIADIQSQYADLALCEASKLKMTAKYGYVWFLPYWVSKQWNDIDIENGTILCSPIELQKAFDGHFTIFHTPFGNGQSIMQEGISVSEWLREFNSDDAMSRYSGFAYDAVWSFAYAADKLLRESHSALINDLRTSDAMDRLVEHLWQTDFWGLSGRVRFCTGGSRITDLKIKQWSNNKFVDVGTFRPNVMGEGRHATQVSVEFEFNNDSIKWPWGKPPGDGTYDCYFAKLAMFMAADCENATIIFTSLLCLAMLLILSLLSFLFWKQQYNRKLRRSAKLMRTFGIGLSHNQLNALDKWEIAKDNVVINRRLGEGAFGTVYGGEAHFSQDGWTAVAVKTLKVGASMEDRLDFLSEAEAMKSFSHKNIVKLLGVCLQSEPIYTIMEFMLYGDLKTYLLARRPMVNEKISDDCDISPKRLTMYAMDVARGLNYLVQQKFVHRDVACRNCLVNAQRVVKLGDFGMARPIFDSDYYRFSRKGKLPVRWMSPESLACGLFTFASDIWAFGVVLYEIITFGSSPYQGLSNNQVLQFVKEGNYLQIPLGIKPQLEGLIRACWSQEAKKRPTAGEIIKYISNYPRLLTHCLDFPGASIDTVERDSDNLALIPAEASSSSVRIDASAPTLYVPQNFDWTSYTSENLELSDISANISVNNAIALSPSSSLSTFPTTTPDGYSTMQIIASKAY